MNVGSLSIYLAAAFGLWAFVASIRWARGHEPSAQAFRFTYHGMTLALATGTFFLMLAILMHDFRYEYVIGYSSRDLPLLYLISAFWGGQEGTFLLWALMGALIGYPLFRKRSWEPATVMACYLPTVLFLIGLMLDSGGNPFRLAAQVPLDGRGLNPLLQDPWMASHPPAVFLGYAAMSVPAALALAALFKREEDQWLGTALRWSLLGFISLGTGIILGGFWAYKVLGWGGYWGWDPVENASLVPWIVVTALLHGVLIQKATGALRRTNLVLALGGYLLVVYATFLTRSGVLADFSVHSFPRGSLYRWLVAGMVTVLVVGTFALLRRKPVESRGIEINFGWPFLLSSAIVLLGMSAGLVLIGTSWPIISGFFGQPVLPQIPFYNRANLPLYVIALLVLGIAPFSMWKISSWRQLNSKVYLSVGLALAGTLAAFLLGGSGAAYLALFGVACFALASNLIRLFVVARVRLLNTGAALAHIGFAMMLVGVVSSSAWDHEENVRLPRDESVEAMDRTFTYLGHVAGSEPKDLWLISVVDENGNETLARPMMYETGGGGGQEAQLMRQPAILRSLSKDLYLVPLGLEGGEVMLELQQGQAKPLGGSMLTFSGFETEVGEPGAGMAVMARVEILTHDGTEESVILRLVSDASGMRSTPVAPETLPGTSMRLARMAVEQQTIQIQVQRSKASEVLVINAGIKPLINILWAGTLLMTLGCVVAVVRRYVDHRMALAAENGAGRSTSARSGTATRAARRPPRRSRHRRRDQAGAAGSDSREAASSND